MFRLGNKGIINFIEAIFVIIIIFIAFAVLFPGFVFKSSWATANLVLAARDSILTMDRLNILYNNSFDSNSLQNFIDLTIPTNRSNLVAWAQIDGTLKSQIIVACNCSDSQIQNLTYWMSGMTMNGRPVNMVFVKSNLEVINIGGTNPLPDVLLIWENTNLETVAINASLHSYLQQGGGVVEMNDFTSNSQTPAGGVQQQIFGLTYSNQSDGKNFNKQATSDQFSRKPTNSTDIIYGPYKYFFHIPVPLKTFETIGSFPVEQGMQTPSCGSSIGHGNFSLNSSFYNFWICNSSTVYFDTNLNGSADTAVNVGGQFNLVNVLPPFTLQYINSPSQIGVSFGLNYLFADFIAAWRPGASPPCPQGNAWGQFYTNQLTVNDNNMARIIFNATFPGSQIPDLPVIILNNTGGRTAWIADFTAIPNFQAGCTPVAAAGDDQKFLLASLLFWGSNKQSYPIIAATVKNPLLIPYINVQNLDTYEVYAFSLGLGSPFGS